jgi:4-amino-4-deoxy-L-arabinose transferase-like glycosyltransferase
LLGGYVCLRWANELYGSWAGILALTLWCFSPNILANGQMITPDAASSALGLLATYLFWHWLKRPSWPQTLALGVALGLTELTKTTWLILFPV